MHADRVDVLHGADRYNVRHGVAHDLELYLLPSCDGLLDEHLTDGGGVETDARDLAKLVHIVNKAAACAAKCERRAYDQREADLRRKSASVLDCGDDFGRDYRLADRLHGVLEDLTVFRLVDRLRIRAQQRDAVGFQEACLGKLHGEGETRLPSEGGEKAVGLFLFNDTLDDRQGERLYIDVIRHRVVGHDGRGVGVYEDDLEPLLLEDAARLSAGVVELGGLTDNDGA